MRKELDKFRILVIGEGELRQELQNMMKEIGLHGHITFCGYSPLVPAFISLSNAVVITSTNEGFPFVAIESFALKTPVVAFDIEPMKEVFKKGKCGYLVESFNPKALKNIMADIILKKTDHSKIVSRAFDFYSELLTYEKMFEATLKVYGLGPYQA